VKKSISRFKHLLAFILKFDFSSSTPSSKISSDIRRIFFKTEIANDQKTCCIFVDDKHVASNVRHVEAKYIELSNSFIELKTDFENMKDNIERKKTTKIDIDLGTMATLRPQSQIFHISPMSQEIQPPDFVTKRLESAIIKDGKE
jgi:hypothetical protein